MQAHAGANAGATAGSAAAATTTDTAGSIGPTSKKRRLRMHGTPAAPSAASIDRAPAQALVPVDDSGLQAMLDAIGLKERVWDTFRQEDITDMDALVGLDKADLQGIGITLGAANRILKAVVARTADTAAGPANAI